MTGWRRIVRLVIGIALSVTVYFIIPITGDEDNVLSSLVLSLLVIGVLTAGVLWQVLKHLADPRLRVDGLVFAVVLAVLAFALGFYRLAFGDPGQIPGLVTRLDSLYFTLSTLLTVGFGDIHAAGQQARALVIVAMLFNVVVIATAVTTTSSLIKQRAADQLAARRESESTSGHAAGRGRRTHRNPR